jgi:hypothetical protein
LLIDLFLFLDALGDLEFKLVLDLDEIGFLSALRIFKIFANFGELQFVLGLYLFGDLFDCIEG